MIHVRYSLSDHRPESYKLEVLKRGCCPALAESSFCEDGGILDIAVHAAGLFHVSTYLETRCTGGTDHRLKEGMVPEVLRWLRRVTEAMDSLEEYLIFEEDVSFCLSDLYFAGERGPARLLLKPSGMKLIEGLSSLCAEIHQRYPESNADLIARRLCERNAAQLMDRSALLSFLSAWACELRT
ncbi:MAG TPA: hypothetical protein DF480_04320 [Clostridiales bacterium]|jgi:hypothetical protein|nr:hypothetical protein [Clostridiales bacterium]